MTLISRTVSGPILSPRQLRLAVLTLITFMALC